MSLSTTMSSDLTSLDGTYGALEIGAAVGTFLYGMETLQAFNYYRNFPKDSVILKSTVASIWLLDLAQTICTLHAVSGQPGGYLPVQFSQNYLMTVTFYDRPPSQEIATPPHSLVLVILFSGVSSTVVQAFYANRIRVLSGTWYLMVICFALIIASLIGALVLMAMLWRSSSALIFLQSQVEWEMIVLSSVGPAVDILIATSMCFYLWRLRKAEPEFRRTQNTLDTLILWTVETTLLTSLAAIIQIVLFLTRKDMSFMAFYIIQPKLFSNSMLAVLNGRTQFRFDDHRTRAGVSQSIAFELPASRPDANHSASFASASASMDDMPS
ncbi:hypothetical protein B0H17DRAFT_1047065 [Mycena rosella]|uniref:DUF6534 domain-containing protein n=1 Tax=Mycena rosella TaxID=1033263 RepID=A0AAD7DW25_MYCRO|nr:hypothetical protein B0H17DRAFT_1047065 [Mycena rosella]